MPIGEVLIDRSSAFLFRSLAAPVGGTATHSIRIPANSELAGLSFSIQAGVGMPIQSLCNAVDAVLGTQPPLTAAFTASPLRAIAPVDVQFTDQSTGSPSAYAWDFGDGGSASVPNPVHRYSSPGVFTVSLTVTGAAGSATTSKPSLITVQDPGTVHNVVLILADDLGVTDVERYGLNPALPPGLTPNIDALADQGVLFETAWAEPLCSPTRAAILTGRTPSRTGIGAVIEKGSVSLGATETTLAEAIELYGTPGSATAAFGKWHLQAPTSTASCTPTGIHGFELFDGNLHQVNGSYCLWLELLCPGGGETLQFQYMPELVTDRAISWMGAQTTSWFAYVAPQEPYEVYHVPPLRLQTQVTGTECSRWLGPKRQAFEAAVQALDTKVGDVVASLGPDWLDTTTIVFAGDNGTPNDALAVWPTNRGKSTLYEGGLRVPLIVAGKGVAPALRGTRTSELAQLTDLYRTIASWSGAGALPAGVAEDSVDLGPFLAGTAPSTGRSQIFAERFDQNALAPPYLGHRVAVRDGRYKLIWSCVTGAPLALFDLLVDPLELTDLLASGVPAPGTPEGDAYLTLRAAIMATIGC